MGNKEKSQMISEICSMKQNEIYFTHEQMEEIQKVLGNIFDKWDNEEIANMSEDEAAAIYLAKIMTKRYMTSADLGMDITKTINWDV